MTIHILGHDSSGDGYEGGGMIAGGAAERTDVTRSVPGHKADCEDAGEY